MRAVERGAPHIKGLSKIDYIRKTKEIVDKEGIDAISIRRIAKEMGCSSASLYRYFDNLTELLYYAELSTLTGYINRLNEAEKGWKNIWDYYVGIWDCYSREAFRHTTEYDLLFMRFDNTKLNVSMKEYYSMFPEQLGNTNQFFSEMLKTPDFMSRDFEICKKCIAEGVIDYEAAVQLNRMACILYKGYFKNVCDLDVQEEEIDRHVELFIKDLDWCVMNLAKDLQGYNGYQRK